MSMLINKLAVMLGKLFTMAILVVGIGGTFVESAYSLTFPIPAQGNVVGEINTAYVQSGDNLSKLGRRYDIGAYELIEANPDVDYLNPTVGSKITIPSRFVLPVGPRKGIVINLAEMRLYYYHPGGRTVSTYPIGIGKGGWKTPIGNTTIVRKRKNPWWIVPKSIINEQRRQGKPIITKMPPGPDNPLGNHAMNLGFKNIVIHGTSQPESVGLRSSHGCIRLYPEDIEALFNMVKVGTSVKVVHQSLKVGRVAEKLFLEAHVPLEELYYRDPISLEEKIRNLANRVGSVTYQIRWSHVNNLIERKHGYPEKIGKILY